MQVRPGMFVKLARRYLPGVMLGTVGLAQTSQELEVKCGGDRFARMWRTAACPKAEDLRCPSIVRSGKDELLLTFHCKEKGTDQPSLTLAGSGNEGRTWADPQTIYIPAEGTAQARGTLARLKSGKLAAG